MFLINVRFVAGFALGAAAALWWARRVSFSPGSESGVRHRTDLRRPERQWLSEYRQGADGRVDISALVDTAVEDTFPASDPPSFMQAIVVGRPPHEEEAAIQTRQRRKRTDEDAFAE